MSHDWISKTVNEIYTYEGVNGIILPEWFIYNLCTVHFIFGIFRMIQKSNKVRARWEVKLGAIWHCLFRQYSDMNHKPRLHIRRYLFAWRMPLSLASLKLIRFLFFSYLTTKKFLSMMYVLGNMVTITPTNLYSTDYVLWSPFQAYRYALLSSNISVDIFS